jgi:hypothetical protein
MTGSSTATIVFRRSDGGVADVGVGANSRRMVRVADRGVTGYRAMGDAVVFE